MRGKMRWRVGLLTMLLTISAMASGREVPKTLKGKHIVVEYPDKLERYAKAFPANC